MLRSYAPDVNIDTVRSLSTAFMDLRAMQESGDLLYPYARHHCPPPRPSGLAARASRRSVLRDRSVAAALCRYSTRELVNIVRHISAFPEDTMEKVLSNVLSFDSFDDRLLERLRQTFAAHGLT